MTISRMSTAFGGKIVWMALASGVSQIATLVAGVLVANTVDTRGFGTYGFFQSTLVNWSTFATMSSGLLATRYVAAYSQSDPRRAGHVLGYAMLITAIAGALVGVVLLVSREALTEEMNDANSAIRGLLIVALTVPLASLSLFLIGALVGLERFRLHAMLSCLQGAVFVAGPAIGAMSAGAVGAVVGLGAAYTFRFVTHTIALYRAAAARGIRISLGAAPGMAGLFSQFALPGVLTGLLSNGAIWFGSYLLVSGVEGPHHMGLFAAALNFRLCVLFLPVQISTIGLPILTRHLTDGEHARFGDLLRGSTIASAVVAVSVATIMGVFSSDLLQLFGTRFSAANDLARLLLIGAVVESVASAMYQALPSRAQMWRSLLLVALPRDGLLILAAILLVPKWQSIGLGVALLASQCVGLAGVWIARNYRTASTQTFPTETKTRD